MDEGAHRVRAQESVLGGVKSEFYSDCNTTLGLLLHPVSNGGSLMNFTHALNTARVEQNTLGESGFAGINVRRDTDVKATASRLKKSRRGRST